MTPRRVRGPFLPHSVHARCPGRPSTAVCAYAFERLSPPGATLTDDLAEVSCRWCDVALDEFPQLRNRLLKTSEGRR
jgi:hypothetical protein